MKQRVISVLAFTFCLSLGTSMAFIKLPITFQDRNTRAAGNALAELNFPELSEPQTADGELVIELYGKHVSLEENLYGTENTPSCCPRSITRTRYRWRNDKFMRNATSEILPNPYEDSSFNLPEEVLRW